MKYLKPIMFVIVGFTIALLVSFKTQEPVKEYAYVEHYLGLSIKVLPDGTKVPIKYGNSESLENRVKILNDMSKEGWILKSSIPTGTYHSVYLERVKQ